MNRTAARTETNLRQRTLNFAASFFFVSCTFVIYRFSPHSSGLLEFSDKWSELSGTDVLTGSYVVYSVALLLFYFTERGPRESKSIAAMRAFRALGSSPLKTLREGLPYSDRLGLLTVLLKAFFAPLMLLSLYQFTSNMGANGLYLFEHFPATGGDFLRIFNSHGFWFLFQLALFFDVSFYTIGYLIEHRALKNEIRSVDPTWLGWAVALACYPPFNGLVVQVMGWGGVEFPQFDSPVVHIAVNSLLLFLMAIYASASVALNLKASNLTHRGIISHGPYRYVRHPAYICKNAAWWLGLIPALVESWNDSAWAAVVMAGSAMAWTAIYALRALTEEDHLRKVDGEYDEYCTKVRYRFIPRVY
jgi:protein-S-isoprenylcysteine O-methyltransferase Ste14